MGPTASGKSAMAVDLAKKFNGVIISADSRQVYRGMTVATAKISKVQMQGVRHYMIDVVSPDDEFNVALFQQKVYAILRRIAKHNETAKKPVIPFLVGGTGLYVRAITDDYRLSVARPDQKLRDALETMPLAKLAQRLLRLDRDTRVDLRNRRRVIRAIEKHEASESPASSTARPPIRTLKLGIEVPLPILEQRIAQRIAGLSIPKLVRETKSLTRRYDLSSNPMTALYYRLVQDYIDGKVSLDQLQERLARMDRQYAKRQLTWLKKEPNLHWITSSREAANLIRNFLVQ